MKIAICDDDVHISSKLEELLEECFVDRSHFESDVFLSGEDLRKRLSEDPFSFQIYILDIEMQELDGLELAEIIREKDKNAIIIFVTNHRELMQKAFEVWAFHFLTKPLNIDKTKKTILKAISSLKTRKTVFQYSKRKRIYSLFFEQIEYFESFNRKIRIHCQNNRDEIYYGNMDQVLEKVSSLQFVQVHKSYVVNMDCITTMGDDRVILSSGTEISITKKYYNSFNATYRNFVMMRMDI